jgi:predicted DNA-binding protein YlxM (UPF0122 family)
VDSKTIKVTLSMGKMNKEDQKTAVVPVITEGAEALLKQALEIWFDPEIERRINQGRITTPFILRRAQLIQTLASSGKVIPEIRLNEEVSAVLLWRANRNIAKGEHVVISEGDIHSIEGINLAVKDQGRAHFTIIMLGEYYIMGWDCTPNYLFHIYETIIKKKKKFDMKVVEKYGLEDLRQELLLHVVKEFRQAKDNVKAYINRIIYTWQPESGKSVNAVDVEEEAKEKNNTPQFPLEYVLVKHDFDRYKDRLPSKKHQLILEYWFKNPHLSFQTIAKEIGVDRDTISTVINSYRKQAKKA